MSMRNVGIVYRKELTEALRDRRTVISTRNATALSTTGPLKAKALSS